MAGNQDLGRFFELSKTHGDCADYTVREAPEAYDCAWLPTYESEFVPKFLVADWISHSTQSEAVFTGDFLFGPNLWHAEGGPGEHAGTPGIHRWIAWYVLPHAHVFLVGSSAQRLASARALTSMSAKLRYTYDNTRSEIPLVADPQRRILRTVRDLSAEDIPALELLRSTACRILRERYGVSPEEIAMYFHYPMRSRLAVLHLHVCIGHRETGALEARSHSLDKVLQILRSHGTYDDPLLFSSYNLRHGQDGSLEHILQFKGRQGDVKAREIDLVVPCAEKDAELLRLSIASLKSCCKQLRRVVVISPRPMVPAEDAEWFDEAQFPFSKEELGTGWRYQQALKLCASFVVPDLLEDVLVVDADTVWHRRNLEFVRSDGVGLYSLSADIGDVRGYGPFFQDVVFPLGVPRLKDGMSAICHHMLFKRHILCDLSLEVQRRFGKPLWKVFSQGKPSEWELYLNFAAAKFASEIAIRPLQFVVTGDIEEAKCTSHAEIDFIVCHSHRRLGFVDRHDDGDYDPRQHAKWKD